MKCVWVNQDKVTINYKRYNWTCNLKLMKYIDFNGSDKIL